jgi:hypothetical protein
MLKLERLVKNIWEHNFIVHYFILRSFPSPSKGSPTHHFNIMISFLDRWNFYFIVFKITLL